MAPPNQRYELPLQILLVNLQELKSTGSLQTRIAGLVVAGKQMSRECRVELVLERGAVQQCTIYHPNGEPLAQGNAAWLVVQTVATRRLTWQFSQEQPSRGLLLEASPARMPARATPPGMSPGRFEVIPYPRPGATTSAVLAELSREQRRVLALVDGRRSVLQIAELLSAPPEYIHHALRQYHFWQLIFYEA